MINKRYLCYAGVLILALTLLFSIPVAQAETLSKNEPAVQKDNQDEAIYLDDAVLAKALGETNTGSPEGGTLDRSSAIANRDLNNLRMQKYLNEPRRGFEQTLKEVGRLSDVKSTQFQLSTNAPQFQSSPTSKISGAFEMSGPGPAGRGFKTSVSVEGADPAT